ncbi:MAG: flagellar hook-basal body complex protein FliE [Pirellulaceae bacterium]
MNVSGVNLQSLAAASPASPGQKAAGAEAQQPFKDLLLKSLNEVNDMQVNADKAVNELLTGGEANMAEVFTAVQKADISFRMMMQIRNKLVQAYQEVKDIRI